MKSGNGNVFVELFSRDLDKKMTSASYKRERNKNEAAPCEADNLFNLFTTCPYNAQPVHSEYESNLSLF